MPTPDEALAEALDLVRSLARTMLRERADFDPDCDLVGFSGVGRCLEPAVSVKWENGFPDFVCEEHAERARGRGALVVSLGG